MAIRTSLGNFHAAHNCVMVHVVFVVMNVNKNGGVARAQVRL